jgi:CelD/BcsL family acetyltransferase involved in cellulose biosynthesis
MNVISPTTESLNNPALAEPAEIEPSAHLRMRTFTSFDDARCVAEEWDDLLDELDGPLYMSFSWCEVWWRHYGHGRELRLITVHADDGLVGVLPMFIERLRVPFLGRARVAKLVGSDSTPTMVDLLVRLEVTAETFAAVVRQLVEEDRADAVHIGPCSGESRRLDAIRLGAWDDRDGVRIVQDRESGSHTRFELRDGFDAYLGGLSKKPRSDYRRTVKRLEETFTIEADVVRDTETLKREFEAFVEMHQQQWRAVGKLGHFGDWPGSRDFARDLVATLSRADQVRMIRLMADGEVVSYNWCFTLNGTYYWRLPARLVGERWDRFSLGRVGLIKMLETASADGATAIEAGTGRYEYKERLNAVTVPLHKITLCRDRLLSRLRVRFTLAYGNALNLAYYRIWYHRVAPRVHLLQRPLWRSWIRRCF